MLSITGNRLKYMRLYFNHLHNVIQLSPPSNFITPYRHPSTLAINPGPLPTCSHQPQCVRKAVPLVGIASKGIVEYVTFHLAFTEAHIRSDILTCKVHVTYLRSSLECGFLFIGSDRLVSKPPGDVAITCHSPHPRQSR